MRKWTLLLGIGAILVLGLMTAALADQTTSLVSVSSDGSVNGGNGPSAVSDNGRFVAFASGAQLTPGTGSLIQVFVKDMQTGAVELASVSSNGTKGNATSGSAIDISDDGRFVVFISSADNLVPGDSNNNADMFIRDRQTDTTERVLGDNGQQGGNVAQTVAISGNGSYVAFVGVGFEQGSPTGTGVFVFERVVGTSERVTDGIDFPASGQYGNVDISNDGQYVVFTTREFNNNDDAILYDRDTDTWEVANPRIGNAAPLSRPLGLSLSGNGRFVAFSSPDNNYVAGDAASSVDVFVYDSNPGTLGRIPAGGTGGVVENAQPVLSDSGRFVAFYTYGDIHGAANGNSDTAVHDRQAGTTEVVSVFEDGSPGDNISSYYLNAPAISSNGRFVVFVTLVGFSPGDNGSYDYYIVDREGVPGPGGGECASKFTDVDGSNTFVDDICWLADQGITRGCNPPANTEYCPKDPVTRGQMAAFLVRALDYTDNGGGNLFIDDNGNTFENDIDKLGTAGVTRGCNPPVNDRYCPSDTVTRGQMAAFLVRALAYTDDGGGNLFIDDNGNTFEDDIDKLGTAGVTRGCNPPVNDRYCPADDVTREQMAAFLRRALEG